MLKITESTHLEKDIQESMESCLMLKQPFRYTPQENCKSQPTTHTCRFNYYQNYDNKEQSLFYLMNHQNLNTQFENSEKFTQQHGPNNCFISIFTKKYATDRSMMLIARKFTPY